MLQSIRLMALPAIELQEQISAELEANPALEVLEDRSEVSIESISEDAGENRDDDPFENASDSGRITTSIPDDEDPNRMFLEGAISRQETLQEHLLSQLGYLRIAPDLESLCESLIQNLDDDGFHRSPPESLCPSCTQERVAEALAIVRALDPLGTGTADYRESLLVQARLDPKAPRGALELLERHVELFENGRLPELRKALRAGEAEFKTILDYLAGLNPFPGRSFSTESARYIVPDLSIRIEDGEFVITLNDEIIPVLGINPFFHELATGGAEAGQGARRGEAEAQAFVKDNVERAKFFIGSIRQRNTTLVKVAKALVRFQRDFFLEGPRALMPLTLRDVADEIGVHETTVSRIVNGKYVQTERGLVELRRFFTNSISGSGSRGSDHSKEGVKEQIKEILSTEKGARGALSDREIMEVLARRGVRIARRTVAKYRGELDLESSFTRGKS